MHGHAGLLSCGGMAGGAGGRHLELAGNWVTDVHGQWIGVAAHLGDGHRGRRVARKRARRAGGERSGGAGGSGAHVAGSKRDASDRDACDGSTDLQAVGG